MTTIETPAQTTTVRLRRLGHYSSSREDPNLARFWDGQRDDGGDIEIYAEPPYHSNLGRDRHRCARDSTEASRGRVWLAPVEGRPDDEDGVFEIRHAVLPEAGRDWFRVTHLTIEDAEIRLDGDRALGHATAWLIADLLRIYRRADRIAMAAWEAVPPWATDHPDYPANRD